MIQYIASSEEVYSAMSTHIFEPITDRFGYGKYLDTEIVIDSKTKYINASKICKQNGKKLKNWLINDGNQELVESWLKINRGQNSAPYYDIDRTNVVGIPKSDQDKILGKYFHEDLLIMIAQWVSKDFAFKVIDIIKNYNDRHNKALLKEKDDKIDEQSKKIEELLAMSRTIISMNHDQNAKLDNMSAEISRIRHHLDNETSRPNKRELILVYRNKDDSKAVMRIRAGTEEYLKKFRRNAVWYREYSNISNSKKAINYMKDNGMITFEKGKTTKTVIHDINERNHLRQCLKKLDESYA